MNNKDYKAYNSWVGMRQRCENPKNPNYPYYGGRGVSVCERWDTFKNFLEDMGERPEGLTLDRIDVDGNYEPSNCKWATRVEQSRNRRPFTFTYTQSDELKARRSEMAKAQWAKNGHNKLGTVQSEETKGKIGKANTKCDEFKFKHDSGLVVTATRNEMVLMYNLHPSGVSQLISGVYKKSKGWALA